MKTDTGARCAPRHPLTIDEMITRDRRFFSQRNRGPRLSHHTWYQLCQLAPHMPILKKLIQAYLVGDISDIRRECEKRCWTVKGSLLRYPGAYPEFNPHCLVQALLTGDDDFAKRALAALEKRWLTP